MKETMARDGHNADVVQWLQRSYLEIPETSPVFVVLEEMYKGYCDSRSGHTDMSTTAFRVAVEQIFGKLKTVPTMKSQKIFGLRLNFLEDKPCDNVEREIAGVAHMLDFFSMTTRSCESNTVKFGFATGLCANRNEILKVIEIQPDGTYELSVGGRTVNKTVIGMGGVTLDTYTNIKMVFNTLRRCTVCQGKTSKSKKDVTRYGVVQEWSKKGQEDDIQLRLTGRTCQAVVPFSVNWNNCKSCQDQRSRSS